jgi:hypothetical protein
MTSRHCRKIGIKPRDHGAEGRPKGFNLNPFRPRREQTGEQAAAPFWRTFRSALSRAACFVVRKRTRDY